MLPNEGPLTATQQEDVRKALVAYIKKHDISQAEVARQISGMGKQALSPILNGKYGHGPLDDHLRELNNWMEVDARRRRTKPDDRFIETRVAKMLIGAASKASQMRCMAIAHGATGIGKTMVAHAIVKKFSGAIYLRISAGNATYMQIRRMLATRLRLYGTKRKKADNATLTFDEKIFDKLHGSHRMIIVDEAHRIADSGLEFLRDVHDECGVPILFLCTKDLVDRIRRDNDEDHGQMYSRFAYVCDLTRGRDKTGTGKKPLFTVAEIRALFETDKVKLHPGAQAYLMDVANTLGYGSLRRCRSIMEWAIAIERYAKRLGPNDRVTITATVLRKAETEPMADGSMLDDINSHRMPLAATA